jgi:hypothetical protein
MYIIIYIKYNIIYNKLIILYIFLSKTALSFVGELYLFLEKVVFNIIFTAHQRDTY